MDDRQEVDWLGVAAAAHAERGAVVVQVAIDRVQRAVETDLHFVDQKPETDMAAMTSVVRNDISVAASDGVKR